jgi:glycosyltransferase involved in cell wall biosynthesis
VTTAPPEERRVLVLSADSVGSEMAGAGIRSFELARALSARADVTLAAPSTGEAGRPATSIDTPSAVSSTGPRLVDFDPHDPASIGAPLAAADVVIAPPLWPRVARAVRRRCARTIFDLYVPEPLETMEHMSDRGRLRRLMYALALDRLDEALHSGHHLFCASEKQRDLWLGALLARRLISTDAYDSDPSLRSLIDVVPFGVPADPPEATAPGPRDRFPQLSPDDEIVLWNGGLWGWLDAPTAIRAVAQLAERRPRLKLIFMGGSSRPAARAALEEARSVAAELGLLDRRVLFNESWVPYAERGAWLLAADCALSTHRDHLETRFAFRTRLLDCFWSGLPIVCTAGDDLGDRVERDGLGATAPPGSVDGVTSALARVLEAGKARYEPGLARAAQEHAWARVAEPLVRWIGEEGPPPSRIGSGRGAYGHGVGQRLRTGGYRAARRMLDSVGLRGWPRL